MVTAGLYKHHKGNYYRVLFLAKYDGKRPLDHDEEVVVFADQEVGLLRCFPSRDLKLPYDLEILRAKNSTDSKPSIKYPHYVVYVGLYPSSRGRVSVRELTEFEGLNDAGAPRFQRVEPNCHACSYAGMGPDDPYLVCGHPDAGIMGTFIKKEPLDHCPGFSKFEQHPGRNPDGTLVNSLVDNFTRSRKDG